MHPALVAETVSKTSAIVWTKVKERTNKNINHAYWFTGSCVSDRKSRFSRYSTAFMITRHLSPVGQTLGKLSRYLI